MADYVSAGVPFYRSKEIIEKHKGNIISTELFISEEQFNAIKEKFGVPTAGDILLTSVGTLGVPYQVTNIDHFYFKDGNLTWFKNFKKNLNSDYLYFWFTSTIAKRKIDEVTIGSTQQALTIAALNSITIDLPPISVQNEIVKHIDSISKKILLNRQINKTLELMAQALFKSWFVDFDPVVDNALDAGFFEQDLEFSDELLRRAEARKAVRESVDFKPLPEDIRQLFPAAFEKCPEPSLGLGGWVPEGWKVKVLGEITSELRRGISPKYIEEGGVQVINQKCIRNHEVSYEPARRHDQEAKRIDGRALKLGDVLVNSTGVGTLGRVAQVTHLSETTVADSHVTVVRVSDNACPIFTFGQLMLSMEGLIERLGEGSTGQTELSRKILSEQLVVLPPFDIAEKAERSFNSFSEKQVSNRQQSSELIKLRDTLLPKLISGELRISDSEVDTIDQVLA
ncbi:EcoKI restriction-modification system protein HsdS [Serratia quinivorans]|nr:EcoKI restriction-modification system protein HsdS [Serratia quinivorans]CAI1943078.1 EcoKI restriction-modification system protein HsdS [Serratia quinivorans]